MNKSAPLTPDTIILSAELKRSMDRHRLSLRDVLLTFNDPEQKYPMWDESGPLASLKAQELHIRERAIGGRRLSLLCRWQEGAGKWELVHCTVYQLVQ